MDKEESNARLDLDFNNQIAIYLQHWRRLLLLSYCRTANITAILAVASKQTSRTLPTKGTPPTIIHTSSPPLHFCQRQHATTTTTNIITIHLLSVKTRKNVNLGLQTHPTNTPPPHDRKNLPLNTPPPPRTFPRAIPNAGAGPQPNNRSPLTPTAASAPTYISSCVRALAWKEYP